MSPIFDEFGNPTIMYNRSKKPSCQSIRLINKLKNNNKVAAMIVTFNSG